MKFLCIACDTVMSFAERQLPGDGTMTAVFTCASCGREVAMLTNPMETQLVSSLGIQVGGRSVPEQPMELVRGTLATGGDVFADAAPAVTRVTWSDEATERLARVPSFVRGMVKRIYTDYATERGVTVITPDIMDRARVELGLEGM
ncbi:MAG TPA: PCP reductase family protein [Longimicrobiales bacterium]